MFRSISFIGSGRIARIMLSGWNIAGRLPARVLAYDADPQAIATLQASFPVVTPASLEEAAGADLVFGALHPPAMAASLPALAQQMHANAVFCSLAPVIRLETLQQKLGGFARLARLNPNAPSIVGAGYNPISFSEGLPQDARAALLDLLKPLGQTPVVPDKLIEIYALVSAMGPTYFWFQFEELRHMGESWGLSAQAAREAISSMLHGAVDTLFSHGLPAETVLDLVPVHPMGEHENAIREMMRERIGALHTKLHPNG